MIRIRTSSRLHFGLFSLPCSQTSLWLNQERTPVLPRRHFGGVGLMIEQPGIDIAVARANTWSAEGALAQRALAFAQRYCTSAGLGDAFQLRIASAASEHAGLGTGTQLGMAVARAVAELTQQPTDVVSLARHVGRGLRSALGIHGFAQGGFLVEGGKYAEGVLSPLVVRHDFPDEWRILLILPTGLQGAHGQWEQAAFANLATQANDDRRTETLCRLVLLNMLPALLERDLDTFGESLYDFNRRVGEMFQSVQGGLYAHPHVEQLVTLLRGAGIKGVGQSSWGPAVFAVVPAERAGELRDWLTQPENDVIVANACNQGTEFAACGLA